ncbi:hypothetical protein OKA04_09390 [Luteolibacter flavescens]|uniref:EF-hand domain-containing protein n=1 Tax=Luteolibacter flavescens TaxID=1859460 RepID=A0ABT3FMZ2_9BACT|nr:hypothetical protein [Luteolibacter flavescens]MCW1884940.1 hypothetical protein [Luteolibacter flavescens]
MKATTLLLILASLMVTVDAKPNRAAQRKRDIAEQKREQKEREARERKRDAIQGFLRDRDKNKDGSLSRDEFLTGEPDKARGEKRFDRFNKNGDRALSKSEIQDLLGL